jgi:hypothetical protein
MSQITGHSKVTGQPKDILVHLRHKDGTQTEKIRKITKNLEKINNLYIQILQMV